jgi:hypothetical protein
MPSLPLRKLTSLTRSEWADLARAQGALLAAQLAVWMRPTGQLVGGATPATDDPAPRPVADLRRARCLALAVERASERGLFRPRCLVRAIALQRLLARAGLEAARVRVGVRLADEQFHAHAWVEHEGEVLGDRREYVATFAPLTDVQTLERR